MLENVRNEIKKLYADGSFRIEITERGDAIAAVLWHNEYGDRETLFVVSSEDFSIEQVAIMVDVNMCYYKAMYYRLYNEEEEEEGGEEE